MSERWKDCPDCDGEGTVPQQTGDGREAIEISCSACEGSGQVEMSAEEIAEADAAHAYDKWKADRLGV